MRDQVDQYFQWMASRRLRSPSLWLVLGLLASTVSLPLYWGVRSSEACTIRLSREVDPADPTASEAVSQRGERPAEVVFVLDTTGSMSGLIEGAKQKIWRIASALAQSQTQSGVRIGLIAYRDRGDVYVTRRFDLSSDIDSVYAMLLSLAADGGGDHPEAVNQALREAVDEMSWSDGPGVYRAIFLVGDAPPQLRYAQDVSYPVSVARARERGIFVNAIQCGQDAQTERVWREIASLSRGEYLALAQDGGIAVAATPMDAELGELSRRLRETAVAYGSDADRVELERKLERASRAAPAAAAERLAYMNEIGGRLNSGRPDLVDALEAGDVTLEEVPSAALPAELKKLSADERADLVARKRQARKQLQARVSELVAERKDYLEQRKEGESDAELGFDVAVEGLVENQRAKETGELRDSR